MYIYSLETFKNHKIKEIKIIFQKYEELFHVVWYDLFINDSCFTYFISKYPYKFISRMILFGLNNSK